MAVTLLGIPTASQLNLFDHSFSYCPPILRNSLPKELRQSAGLSSGITSLPLLAPSSAHFHSKLKTFTFTHSYPPWPVAPYEWISVVLVLVKGVQFIYLINFYVVASTLFSVSLTSLTF